MNRAPVFELHIRPMFRLLDRDHMLRLIGAFDLWDLGQVWERRHVILERIKNRADMPGDRYGGPYPDEWIAVFERWMATGTDAEPGHHLVLATSHGAYQVQSLGGMKRRISVQVAVPFAGCHAWFDLQGADATERRYTLYLEPPYPVVPPAPQMMEAKDTFAKDAPDIVVTDALGAHNVAVP